MAHEFRGDRRAAARRRVATALAVIIGMIVAAVGWLAGRPHVLEAFDAAVPVMRVHVVPNSNSVDDQTLKLHVRDALLPLIYDMTGGADLDEGRTRLLSNVDALQETAQAEIRRRGADYDVAVVVEAADGAEATALKIIIGVGAGNNWFCVLVPPLCFADLDAVEKRPVDTAEQQGGVRFAWRWLGDLFARLALPVEGVGEMDQNDIDTDLAHTSPRDGDVGTAAE